MLCRGASPDVLRRRALPALHPAVWPCACGRSAGSAPAEQAPLEVSEPSEQLVHGHERRPSREADERHFERCARLSAANDLVERSRKTLMQAREIVAIRAGGEGFYVRGFCVGEVEQARRICRDL